MSKNEPIRKHTRQTADSKFKVFPGSSVIQGISGLERKIPKFKDVQVAYEPYLAA